jgi:hypothetical protein
VRYLAASPETMLAPGVPSAAFANTLSSGGDWPKDAVDVTMKARYGTSHDAYHPAAAFDVLDLDPGKIATVRASVASFNHEVAALPKLPEGGEYVHDIRNDLRGVRGMVRFDHSAEMPWHADRPAIASYQAIADDGRLPEPLREAAAHAAAAVNNLVLAHKESSNFGPFHSSYADAVGPTVHLPITKQLYDSWADQGVVETHNDFFDAVHGREFARAIGSYNHREDVVGAAAA